MARGSETSAAKWLIKPCEDGCDEHHFITVTNYIDNVLAKKKKMTEKDLDYLRSKIWTWASHAAKLRGRLDVIERVNESLKREYKMREEAIIENAALKIELAKYKQNTNLIICTKDERDAKITKKRLANHLYQRREGLLIKGKKISNNVVLVKSVLDEERNEIIEKTNTVEQPKCELPKKRRPLVILYHVLADTEDRELIDAIYDQNLMENLSKEDYRSEIKIKFKTGPKDRSTIHYVLEVSPRLRKLLFLNSHRVYVGNHALSVKDYLVVPRCFKCCDLGHISTFCKSGTQICAQCGEAGHKQKDCKETEKQAKCIPCVLRGKKCSEDGKDCPTYQMLLEREISRTDYGQ